jgi:hypothetical protein
VLTDAKGRRHIIAHFQTKDIPALHEMQRRFDGELGVWSSNFREWVPISDFELDSAKEWEPHGGDPAQGENEARRLYG